MLRRQSSYAWTGESIVKKGKSKDDESQVKEVFINEGRGNSPSHLKFFLLVISKLKEDIK